MKAKRLVKVLLMRSSRSLLKKRYQKYPRRMIMQSLTMYQHDLINPPHVKIHAPAAPPEPSPESIEKRVEHMRKEERIRTTELSEVKKRLNALVNRRAAVISTRFSGPKQDDRLGDSCRQHDEIEAEIVRLNKLQQKFERMNKKSLVSSPLVNGGNSMPIEKLLLALEKSQISVKDKV